MLIERRTTFGKVRPPRLALNRRDQLARGLCGFWVFEGRRAHEYVRGAHADSASTEGDPILAPTKRGVFVDPNTVDCRYEAPLGSCVPSNTDLDHHSFEWIGIPDPDAGDTYGSFFAFGGGGSGGGDDLLIGTSGTTSTRVYQGGDLAEIAFTAGTLVHFVITWQGTSWTAYLNGVEGASGTAAAPNLNSTSGGNTDDEDARYFGGDNRSGGGSQENFNGVMILAAVWDRVLTPADVKKRWNDPWGPVTPVRRIPTGFASSAPTLHTLSGDVDAEPAVSGDLRKVLAGDASAEPTVSGDLQKVLSGSVSAEPTVSGDLQKDALALSGAVDAEPTVSGDLIKKYNLSGAVSAEPTVSGNLIKAGEKPMFGSVSAEPTVRGSLTLETSGDGTTIQDTHYLVEGNWNYLKENITWSGHNAKVFDSAVPITAMPGDFATAFYYESFYSIPPSDEIPGAGRSLRTTIRFFGDDTTPSIDVFLRMYFGHTGDYRNPANGQVVEFDMVSAQIQNFPGEIYELLQLAGVDLGDWDSPWLDAETPGIAHGSCMSIEFRLTFTGLLEADPNAWTDTDTVPINVQPGPYLPFYAIPDAPTWTTATLADMLTDEIAEWSSQAARQQFGDHEYSRADSGESGNVDGFGPNHVDLDYLADSDARAQQWVDLHRKQANHPDHWIQPVTGELFDPYDARWNELISGSSGGIDSRCKGYRALIRGGDQNWMDAFSSRHQTRTKTDGAKYGNLGGKDNAHWHLAGFMQVWDRYRSYTLWQEIKELVPYWMTQAPVTPRGMAKWNAGTARARGRKMMTGVCLYLATGEHRIIEHLRAMVNRILDAYTKDRANGAFTKGIPWRTSKASPFPRVVAPFEVALYCIGSMAAITLDDLGAARKLLLREYLIEMINWLIDYAWKGTTGNYYIAFEILTQTTAAGPAGGDWPDSNNSNRELSIPALQWGLANSKARLNDPTKCQEIVDQYVGQNSRSTTEWPADWRWRYKPPTMVGLVDAEPLVSGELTKADLITGTVSAEPLVSGDLIKSELVGTVSAEPLVSGDLIKTAGFMSVSAEPLVSGDLLLDDPRNIRNRICKVLVYSPYHVQDLTLDTTHTQDVVYDTTHTQDVKPGDGC